MPRFEYEHAFVQHLTETQSGDAVIPLDVKEALTAWGADGWEVVHMEAVWTWRQEGGASWPECLRGYYVTFKRGADGAGRPRVAFAEVEVPATEQAR
jgi:hypothetical protein